MNFSLVIPSYNEARNLPGFLVAATECLDGEDIDYELIFVNDGSADDTPAVLERAIARYRAAGSGRATITVVDLSRNFGKEAALYAGLEHATGDCVGFIDADMQQDPQVAFQMYRYLEEHSDTDCVAAVPEKRCESLPLRVCKRLFYQVFNGMSETRIIADVSDFRVFRRPVAEALLSLHEQFRFSKGLFAWVGFNTHVIPYEVHERHYGVSRWTLRKLVSYAWNGVLAFSTWPLRLIMYAGMVLAFVSLVFFGLDLYDKIAYNSDIAISQVLLYVVLLLGGIQMFVLGVFGEYMARAYIESKHRPIYLTRNEYVSRASSATGGGSEQEAGSVAPAPVAASVWATSDATKPESTLPGNPVPAEADHVVRPPKGSAPEDPIDGLCA